MTLEEMARELDVTRQALSGWINNEGCPRGPLEAIRRWHAQHKRPRFDALNDNNGTAQQALLLNQALLKQEQRRGAKLKNDRLENKLVLRDDAQQTLNAVCALVRDRILGWPDRLHNEWPAELRDQVTQRLEHEVRLLLTELADARIE